MSFRLLRILVAIVVIWAASACTVNRQGKWRRWTSTENVRETGQTVELNGEVQGTDLVVQAERVRTMAHDVHYYEQRDYYTTEYHDLNSGLMYVDSLFFPMDFLVGTIVCIEYMFDDEKYIAGGPGGWLLSALPFVTAMGIGTKGELHVGDPDLYDEKLGVLSSKRAPLSTPFVVSGAGETAQFETDAKGKALVPLYLFAVTAVQTAKNTELVLEAGGARTVVTVPFEALIRAVTPSE